MNTSTLELRLLDNKKIFLDINLGNSKALQWAKQHADEIDYLLYQSGALVIRGLNIMSSKQFAQILKVLFSSDLLDYSYRSTPRTELKDKVYTATEYHQTETIPQHNEHAYANKWPMRLGLCCLKISETGGETPLADSREVFNLIPKEIREKFDKKGVKYVRNYGNMDLPWTEVFQTTDKVEVESYCRKNNLTFEWLDDGNLRTTQINPAIARHPVTKEWIWFNQAHLFHVSALGEEYQTNILSFLGEEKTPRNAYYGDGEPIEEEVLELIRGVYEECTFYTPWHKGDLVLVDNMLFTHGRRPFQGERRVLVGMARELNWANLE